MLVTNFTSGKVLFVKCGNEWYNINAKGHPCLSLNDSAALTKIYQRKKSGPSLSLCDCSSQKNLGWPMKFHCISIKMLMWVNWKTPSGLCFFSYINSENCFKHVNVNAMGFHRAPFDFPNFLILNGSTECNQNLIPVTHTFSTVQFHQQNLCVYTYFLCLFIQFLSISGILYFCTS